MNILGQYHTGFVVENLEASLHFYIDILGLKIERGPGVQSGKWISDVVGLEDMKLKMAFVGTGDGHSIELFEYICNLPPISEPKIGKDLSKINFPEIKTSQSIDVNVFQKLKPILAPSLPSSVSPIFSPPI